jgi:hypothetical protein
MKVSSNTPVAPSSRPAHSTARPLVRLLRVLLGVAALGLGLPRLASADTKPACRVTTSLHAHGLGRNDLSQDNDDTSSGKGASPEQIEKYVAVYRAMQRNHNLTIEQAAGGQGLTVAAFRELEQRIESDELARDDARRALAASAPSEAATTTPTEKARP